MNLKEHIIEVNDEKLDNWNYLNWDNPNPYDYRYYKMLGLALFERISEKNLYSLDMDASMNYMNESSFLTENSYIIYSLCKNSILDFKLILSLYDAYLKYFTYFVNRNNIDSKFYKEVLCENLTGNKFKREFLNTSFNYRIEDLSNILNGKKLIYGDTPDNYKDFLVAMHQMALMMRWRVIRRNVYIYKVTGSPQAAHYASTYNQAFNDAYDAALSNLVEIATASSPYIGSSDAGRVRNLEGDFSFFSLVSVVKDFTINSYQLIPYDSEVELYIGRKRIFEDGSEASLNGSFDDSDPYFLTDTVMLYDKKIVKKNEKISFKIDELRKRDYMLELPSYDKDEEFRIDKDYSIDFLMIYDCNNSYKLKAN